MIRIAHGTLKSVFRGPNDMYIEIVIGTAKDKTEIRDKRLRENQAVHHKVCNIYFRSGKKGVETLIAYGTAYYWEGRLRIRRSSVAHHVNFAAAQAFLGKRVVISAEVREQ